MEFDELLSRQHRFFASGATRSRAARCQALDALLQAVTQQESQLLAALEEDLGKSPFEGYMTELGLVRDEIRYHRKHLKHWMKDHRQPTPLSHFPASCFQRPEPYGSVLILSPWNYPIQLSLVPLIGAISAGNCVILKPSAYAPACSHALAHLLTQALPSEWAAVQEGGRAENQALLQHHFDLIFFTGSVAVGQYVMERAAQTLTPVILELGGKSPVIVTADADLRLAARRILFGKLLNSGQTCVAPDYLLVEHSVQAPLTALLQDELVQMLGENPLSNPDFPRIVNEAHLRRLMGLLTQAHILCGGTSQDGRMAPTLLDQVELDAPVMQEEIFGPILPILPFYSLEDAIAFVQQRPKPLALYLFSRSPAIQNEVMTRLSFGGGCINDTIVHLATPHLPFGGVGMSGMGSYHGKASFDAFTHYKSVLHQKNWLDLPFRYHPYTTKKERMIRRFLR